MTWDEEHAILERYSAGEITRKELERALGRDTDFADALRLLHKHELKLPRRRLYPQGPAVDVLRQQLRRAARG